MANEYGSGGGVSVQLAGPFANSGGNVIFTTVTLPAANWKNGESPYFQEVTVPYVSNASMVNIHPGPEQLAAMKTIFLARNDNGTVTVYAIGAKPDQDYTFQASVTDGLNASVILGLPAGQNVSQFTADQLGIDVGVKTVNGNAPDEFGNVDVEGSGGFNGTINGQAADEDGNFTVDVGVKTVNGEAPDESGNIVVKIAASINGEDADENGDYDIDVGVKTVNGNAPDENGNVDVNATFNGTINGVEADEDGNFDLEDNFLEIMHNDLLMGTEISIVRSGQTVTITETVASGTYTIVMNLDEADFPTSVTANGRTVALKWSGF